MIKNNWKKATLGDICEIISGGTPDTKIQEYWNGDIYWATTVDVKEKYLHSTNRTISEVGLRNSSAHIIPINSVLLSSRATVGLVTINKVEVTTNQGFKTFICDPDKIYFEYLYYVLSNLTEKIKSLSSGTTYLEVSKSQILKYLCLLWRSRGRLFGCVRGWRLGSGCLWSRIWLRGIILRFFARRFWIWV